MCTSSPPTPPLITPTAPQAQAEAEIPRVVRARAPEEVRKRRANRRKHGSLLQSLKIPLNLPNE